MYFFHYFPYKVSSISLSCIITGCNEVVAKVMFLLMSVILFTGGRGCLPQCMLGYHTPLEQTPPRADTPLGADIPPGSRHTPLGAGTPRADTSPPRADTPSGADTLPWSRHPPRVAGTHPTGMHSCFHVLHLSGVISWLLIWWVWNIYEM